MCVMDMDTLDIYLAYNAYGSEVKVNAYERSPIYIKLK